MLIAICGGIGSGKSGVISVLKKLGANVAIADEINRNLLTDSDYVKKLAEIFPDAINNNVVNKKIIRNAIFNDENKRKALNNLAHPEIFKKIFDRAKEVDILFVEIPLLIESNVKEKFDAIWAVSAPIETRIERIMYRDNVSKQSAEKIIKAQENEDLTLKIANEIIINDGDFKKLENKVIALFNKYVA